MSQIIDGLVKTFEALGYPGIGILMFLEVLFPPIPSEVIMPWGGSIAKNPLDAVFVALAGTIGSMAGAIVFYYLGKFVGTARLVKFANKYGRWLTVSGKDIRKADAWFDKYGIWVVFFCRFIPGIRSLVSLPAGVAEVKIVPFLLLTLLGTSLWNIGLTFGGYALKENYTQIDHIMGGWGKYILGGCVAILAIIYIWRLVLQMREKPEPEETEAQVTAQNWSPEVPGTEQPAWNAQQPQQQPTWGQQQPQQQQPAWGQPQQQSAWGQAAFSGAPQGSSPDVTVVRHSTPQQPAWGQQAQPAWNAQQPQQPAWGQQPVWGQPQQQNADPDATVIRRPGPPFQPQSGAPVQQQGSMPQVQPQQQGFMPQVQPQQQGFMPHVPSMPGIGNSPFTPQQQQPAANGNEATVVQRPWTAPQQGQQQNPWKPL